MFFNILIYTEIFRKLLGKKPPKIQATGDIIVMFEFSLENYPKEQCQVKLFHKSNTPAYQPVTHASDYQYLSLQQVFFPTLHKILLC